MGSSSGWAASGGRAVTGHPGKTLPEPARWPWAKRQPPPWHPDFGISGIDRDSLTDKLALAKQRKVEEFFLPAEKPTAGALEWARCNLPALQVLPLIPVPSAPRASALLRPYLEHLGAPPPLESPLAQPRPTLQGHRHGAAADNYHWTHLLGDIAESCGKDFRQRHPECKAKHLVTVVSTSPSIVALCGSSLAGREVPQVALRRRADEKGNKKMVPKLEAFPFVPPTSNPSASPSAAGYAGQPNWTASPHWFGHFVPRSRQQTRSSTT